MTEIDPTFEIVEQVTTHSGGLKWSQKRIHNDIWYFTNEAENKNKIMPNWLMSNSCLSRLLGVYSKTLSKFNTSAVNAVTHSDAPTSFYSVNTKQDRFNNTIRTKQTMWTLIGVSNILNNVKSTRSVEFIDRFHKWIDEQSAIYGDKNDTCEPTLELKEQQDEFPFIVNSERVEAKKAANYINQILNQWHKETILNSHLQLSNTKLQNKINELEKQINDLEASIADNKTSNKLHNIKQEAYNEDVPHSLSRFISKLGVSENTDKLTRAGLLNSDQLFSIFNENWKCPKTGKLIHKGEFQAILRGAFHTYNSTHSAPVIFAEALRKNYAAVCRVLCKKKPNPKDAAGNILDIHNPAYLSSDEPCIRLQARYTSKAAEYLMHNWSKLVNKHLAIK